MFGWFAFSAAFIRFQMKTTRQIRIMNVVSCTLFAVHYALLQEWVGPVMYAIASARSLLLLFERFWLYKKIIAIGAIILSTVTLLFTYTYWYDLTALIAITLGAAMDIQSKAVNARLYGAFMHLFWLVYAVFTGSQGGAVNSSVVILSNASGYFRHHLYPYLKTKDKKYLKS